METSPTTHSDDLSELLIEVERAWIDRHDPAVVDRLAATHPEHSGELYEFFAALVDGTTFDATTIETELTAQAVENTHTWLEEAGYERALESAWWMHRARPFVKFLLDKTEEEPDGIVATIGDVSWEFLVQVSRYPKLVPAPVRDELVTRIGRGWQIPANDTLQGLAVSGPVPRAASRDTPFPADPDNFEELLARSSLTKKQRTFWTDLAGP